MVWVAFALLLLAASIFLLLASGRSEQDQVRDNLRLTATIRRGDETLPSAADALASYIPVGDGKEKQEILKLLAQAGLTQYAALYFLLAWGMPVLLAVAAVFYQLAEGAEPKMVLITGFAVFAIGFLLPKRLLRVRAQARMQAMQKEVPQFALMLRMLLDTGMTFEHALNVLIAQASDVIPIISTELKPVQRRLQAGQELGAAIAEFNRTFEQQELRDIFAMLKQAGEQGGNVRESITEYVEYMESKLMTDLRERVGKLSGKLSVVMMLFLFPALLIFIGGPGMLAVVRGIGGL